MVKLTNKSSNLRFFNMNQATELKRVRSKPVEWWANGSSPAVHQTIPSKKRQRASSISERVEKSRKNGNAATRTTKGDTQDDENRDSEPVKPGRRGRSSAGEKELRESGEAADMNARRKMPKTLNQPWVDNEENMETPKASKRRKPSLTAQEEEDGEVERDLLGEDPAALKKQGNPNTKHAQRVEDLVQRKRKQPALEKTQLAINHANTTRRGRSSNTEAELRVVNYKETVSRKPDFLNIEATPSSSVKESTDPRKEKSQILRDNGPALGKNKRASKKLAPPAKIDGALAEDSVSTRRGRSSNTEAELHAVNYKETATKNRSSFTVGGEVKAVSKKSKPSVNQEDEPHAVQETKSVAKKVGRSNPTSGSSSKDSLPTRGTRKQGRVDTGNVSIAEMSEASQNMDGEQRRGRSSNTEAELRAQINYKESKTLKRRDIAGNTVDSQSSHKPDSQVKSQTKRRNIEVGYIQPGSSGILSQEKDGDIEIASSKFSRSRPKATARPTIEAKTATPKSGSTARGPKKSQKNKKEVEATTRSVVPQNTRKSGQPSNGAQKKRKPVIEDDRTHQPVAKRQRSDKAQEVDQPDIVPEYQHLAAITRKVSRATIDSKWDGLPSSCVDRISIFLHDIQRPVIVRLSDDQKRKHASTALQMISRRLVNKIPRGLPFPQSIRNNREDDFNFEKILEHHRALESQLTPALHANELLEAELAKEKEELVAEQTQLDELERNAKAVATTRRQNARNIHALLQPSAPRDTEELGGEFAFNTTDPAISVTDNLLQDENLQAVVQDLQGHVDSIEGNLKQVHGISEAMARSKAAVQATLFGRLDSSRYEDVVLG